MKYLIFQKNPILRIQRESSMPVDILVGTQWGDEGKGKLIDVLTRDVDMVVRFQGGNNAGHTARCSMSDCQRRRGGSYRSDGGNAGSDPAGN